LCRSYGAQFFANTHSHHSRGGLRSFVPTELTNLFFRLYSPFKYRRCWFQPESMFRFGAAANLAREIFCEIEILTQ
jgi:hypothetical protein